MKWIGVNESVLKSKKESKEDGSKSEPCDWKDSNPLHDTNGMKPIDFFNLFDDLTITFSILESFTAHFFSLELIQLNQQIIYVL